MTAILHLFILKSEGITVPPVQKSEVPYRYYRIPVNYGYVNNYKTTGLNFNTSDFSVTQKNWVMIL